VFVPLAFIGGVTGQFYRQFAVTIAVSVLISAFNSLTLSPALAAVLLQPHGAPKDARSTPDRARVRGCSSAGSIACSSVAAIAIPAHRRHHRRAPRLLVVYGAAGPGLCRVPCVPARLHPDPGQAVPVRGAMLPEGATLDRTEAVMRKMGEIAGHARRGRTRCSSRASTPCTSSTRRAWA
jgi:multidrug efflux pump subunit AcrB